MYLSQIAKYICLKLQKVSLKSREVTAERTKTNINMEEIKEKQVESHKIWMKKQLDELREMYEKQKVDVAATMRDMYIQKVKLVYKCRVHLLTQLQMPPNVEEPLKPNQLSANVLNNYHFPQLLNDNKSLLRKT